MTRRRRYASCKQNVEPPRFTPMPLSTRGCATNGTVIHQFFASETPAMSSVSSSNPLRPCLTRQGRLPRPWLLQQHQSGLLYAHNYATRYRSSGKKSFKTNSPKGWGHVIDHGLAGRVTFPGFIDCVYQQDRYDNTGDASWLHSGYAIHRQVTGCTRTL